MQELIPKQVACKKWQAVIFSIGLTKKFVCLTNWSYRRYEIDHLKKRLFGQIDLSTFTHVKTFSSEHLQPQFSKLFPNVENIALNLPLCDILTVLSQLNQLVTLSIIFINDTSNNDNVIKLFQLINLCASIKRLDIRAQTYSQMSLLASTLSRLEQFSYSGFDLSLVQYLGPICVRVSLNVLNENNLTQWHTINSQWLASVTHLELKMARNPYRLIEYFSKHAVALQVLRLESLEFVGTRMNSQLIGHLSKLKNLSEIELSHILVDLLQLEEAARKFELIPLDTIQTFTLTNSTTNCQDNNRFTSVLCTILPNVEHLTFMTYHHNFSLESIEQYLGRFTKLRSHSFN